jgi:hypothetical protein
MTDTVTIPAHVEDGILLLDAPLPSGIVSVEVRVRVAAATPRRSVAEYVRSLPPGTKTGDEIDADIREVRGGW